MPKTNHRIDTTLEKLRAAQARVVALQEKVEQERKSSLETLHESIGFSSRADLIAALERLEGPKRSRAGSAKPRAKRTRITPEMRAQIVEAIQSGQTGVAVAAQFGISTPSLHNIKKAAGLVNSRKG